MNILKIKNAQTGEWQDIAALVGPQGPQGIQGPAGETGPAGADYVLTNADKQEIATIVLANFPSAEEVEY